MGQLLLIAARSLLQHRTRTFLLGAAIVFVTALLLILTSISTGMRERMLEAATTLTTGHVNVGGFYKATPGLSAPVVTDYPKVLEVARSAVPELDYVVQRGRGWAKLISDTGSRQAGVAGIDVNNEPGFRKVMVIKEGDLEGLSRPNSILLFEEQADKLGVKVGDKITLAAPTFQGTNNTADVTVVAIARNVGLLSGWSTFMDAASLRALYQLNENTTGALQLYLKDVKDVPAVQARLREALAKAGYSVMDNDPRAFFMKFDVVNREAWTGQKLDVTNWEDEISFIKWTVTALTALSLIVTVILVVIICVGIMNVMWISIRERTREIGTLRAIGMQRRGILLMFLAEGFLMGFLGTVAGCVVGLLASVALDRAHIPVPFSVQLFLMTDQLVLSPSFGWLVFAVLFITACITAVSLLPSYLAARMKPITAMHHIG